MLNKLKKSPINYFSDLLVGAMVILWIGYCVLACITAISVTFSSIVLTFITKQPSFDVSLWETVGTNVVVPLTAGGVPWMLKCALQHVIANSKGEECPPDFEDDEEELIESEEDI